MELSPIAHEILQRVEEVTGTPVEVIADGSLPVLARVTMARAGASRHVLRVRLGRPIPDYLLAYECGFILRLYANPPAERYDLASSSAGSAVVVRLLKAPGGLAPKLRLSEADLTQYAQMLYDGILTQVRSIPIGMRIDRWIYDTYPDLRQGQSSAVNEQQRTNVQVLGPNIRETSPPKLYSASVSMNAAYALFCDELYGEGGYSVAYRNAGVAAEGARLLDEWRALLSEPAFDRQLVDAWARALGIDKWYRWVPLSAGRSA
jgi:hypothetical protein